MMQHSASPIVQNMILYQHHPQCAIGALYWSPWSRSWSLLLTAFRNAQHADVAFLEEDRVLPWGRNVLIRCGFPWIMGLSWFVQYLQYQTVPYIWGRIASHHHFSIIFPLFQSQSPTSAINWGMQWQTHMFLWIAVGCRLCKLRSLCNFCRSCRKRIRSIKPNSPNS